MKFRADINKFFSTIPDESKFHEDPQNKEIFTIQYERLTPELKHLDFLDKENKEYFGLALFITVLTDMVCFTYFKPLYDKFNRLTRYPKFIGNCPSGCRYHFHPSDIFISVNMGCSVMEPHLLFYDKFIIATNTMKEETLMFFNNHMVEVNGEAFWEKCQQEFPYRTQQENIN